MVLLAEKIDNQRGIDHSHPSRANAHLMFDRIAGRYDLLNRLLSARRDVVWRQKLVEKLPRDKQLTILDLACGTADLALTAQKLNKQNNRIIGIDLSKQMLALAAKKVAAHKITPSIDLLRADLLALPVQTGSVDAAMIAFGIRNVEDTAGSLREMLRVLKPGGQALILEFSLPENRIMRMLYLPYLRYILPTIGRLFSGDSKAYSYLDRTVETYLYGEPFCKLLREIGFTHVTATQLLMGVATIYIGRKK